MNSIILTPDQLQVGLKPRESEYHIDTRDGKAIVLLPSKNNQERPSVDLNVGDSLSINDLYSAFSNTVEVRAPKNGTIDGKATITISENNAHVKFTLINELTWVSKTTFNRPCEIINIEPNETYIANICNFNFLTFYSFDLCFTTKYKTEVVNLQATNNLLNEISHLGEDLISYQVISKDDGSLYLEIESKLEGVLSIIPNSLLRK